MRILGAHCKKPISDQYFVMANQLIRLKKYYWKITDMLFVVCEYFSQQNMGSDISHPVASYSTPHL